jgi:hypothetical protein
MTYSLTPQSLESREPRLLEPRSLELHEPRQTESRIEPHAIEPLERLQIADGLLLTADRWNCAHNYHRQRQNIHYRALYQPGIVQGLGVAVIPAPAQVAAQYRDDRWVQVQPGVAIDALGNPIVVPEAIEFRIASTVVHEPLMVYLVLSYVDPDRLHISPDQETVRETFRLDEKNTPPTEQEIELCRILVQPGISKIERPRNVFFPSTNTLDLRYRETVQVRSLESLRIFQVIQGDRDRDKQIATNFASLLQSTAALYPALKSSEFEPLNLQALSSLSPQASSDLIYLNFRQLRQLQSSDLQALKQELQSGGVLLIEAAATDTDIPAIGWMVQQLKEAIADAADSAELQSVQADLLAELAASQATLSQKIQEMSQFVLTFAQQLDLAPEGLEKLDRLHPLRTQPFLFGQFPTLPQQAIQVLNWQNIVLVIGDLSAAWGLDEELSLSRETIRSAQEMGINILHFAWQYRHLSGLSNSSLG